MTETRKPKYLKQDPPTAWEQQTAEVMAMVNSNPNRRADVDKMTIILEDDRMFLTYPTPQKSEMASVACAVLSFLLAVVIVVVALAAPTIGPRLLSLGAMTMLAVVIIFDMKGEKKNVQRKQTSHR